MHIKLSGTFPMTYFTYHILHLHVEFNLSHFTYNISHVTPRMIHVKSHVIFDISNEMFELPHSTYHIIHVIFHMSHLHTIQPIEHLIFQISQFTSYTSKV